MRALEGLVTPLSDFLVCSVAVSVVVVIIGCLIAIVCQGMSKHSRCPGVAAPTIFLGATGWVLYKNWINVQRISIKSTVRKYIHAFIRTLAFMGVALLGIM